MNLDNPKILRIYQNETGVFDKDQEIHKTATGFIDRDLYNILSLYQDEDWIYYLNTYTCDFCRVSKDGKNNTLLFSAHSGVGVIGVRDGWIYFNRK